VSSVRGLLVGRFQPFHLGHLRALQAIRKDRAEEMILLGIGSAQVSHTPENPFTGGERMEMALRALEESKAERVLPVPLLDIDRHSLWVSYLASLLPVFTRVYTNNPLTRTLFEAAGYEVLGVPWQDREHLEGTAIRREMVSGDGWRPRVPTAVRKYLEEIHGPERLRTLAHAPRPPHVGDRP
jgi:nicotinamide-nucleotide adenylyltransferase